MQDGKGWDWKGWAGLGWEIVASMHEVSQLRLGWPPRREKTSMGKARKGRCPTWAGLARMGLGKVWVVGQGQGKTGKNQGAKQVGGATPGSRTKPRKGWGKP